MRARSILVPMLLSVGLVVSACASGATGTVSGPSGTPVTSGEPSGTKGPSPILSAGDAAAAVSAVNPLFAGIGAQDPNLIGQASWWEANPTEAAKPPVPWKVTFRIGWGDCQAGCIDEHAWTYSVKPDGTVTLLSETGSPLASDVLTQRAAAATWTGVGGLVTAGPTCPVERPGDPACAPRPVDGAELLVTGADGSQAGQATTDKGGLFRLDLAPGDYTLVPQPVQGLMGTAQPVPFSVRSGAETFLEIAYDTGIR